MRNQKGTEITPMAYRAIYFAQPFNLRNLNEFYRVPELIFSELEAQDVELLERRGKSAIQQIINKVENSLLKGRNILDLSEETELLPEEAAKIAKAIQGYWQNNELIIKPNLTGAFDFVQKSNRTTAIEIKSIKCTQASEFTLRSSFNLYWEERYSLAWRSDQFSLALLATSAARGGKGQARLLIKILLENSLYIDDLSKYIETEAFLSNINI